jgi:hypothetical protein
MHIGLQILLLLVPSLIVFATSYFLMRGFLDSEGRRRQAEVKLQNQSVITPIRLQAYERITLFLERISPQSLIMRVYQNGMNSRVFHSELLRSIRSEFEHNMSQQIYMSPGAWQMVKTAKEETTKLINIAVSKVPETATGIELSQVILEMTGKIEKLPTQVATEYIRKEVQKEF